MQFQCAHCRRGFEIAGDPPSFCPYCGQPRVVVEAARSGVTTPHPTTGGTPCGGAAAVPHETVGGYRLVRLLGTGGMGSVHEAEEIATGRRVAVKVLRPQAAASAEALKRFRQEGQLASQINHPNCVFVLSADEEAGRPYIVMELMTGATLEDVLEEEGPLPPEEAVAKVLDVIEGLKEAHSRGILHRDVKPSNCFVLPDGRVKIGDLGLAKSLDRLTHVTASGTFLGTVLFAAPEQIRGEPLDYRTDVYAVAATLYHLLTGQAPFQKYGNVTAALAAIVSEPAPPLRAQWPDLSTGLEKVVLRGLERNPARRWPDLEAFRTALLPFLPGRLSFGGLGTRLAAYLLDCALFLPYWLLVGLLFQLLPAVPVWQVVGFLVKNLPFLVYFIVLEGIWRASFGKRLLRLRVSVVGSAERAGLRRAALRSAVFLTCLFMPRLLLELGTLAWNDPFWLTIQGISLILLAAPMAFTTGLRGLHEVCSGTQVLSLPPAEKPQPLESRRPDRQLYGLGRPEGMPDVVGPYPVRGALYWGQAERVLLAEDPMLWRDIWIWLRPASGLPLPAARRELDRPTRLRWVTGGELGAVPWDAFVAPPGCLLSDLVNGDRRLAWRDVRMILQQLADELSAACAGGSLPATLAVDQVWVQPNGRVQLLDFSLSTPAVSVRLAVANPQQRALALLGKVLVLSLEGRARPAEAAPTPVAAPLPDHAARICRRLLAVRDPYLNLADLQGDLTATRDRPTEVTRTMRACHLGVLFLFLFPGLTQMLSLGRSYGILLESVVAHYYEVGLDAAKEIIAGRPFLSQFLDPLLVSGAIAVWPTLWIGWAFLVRGGISYPLSGLSLVRADGRRAARWQCAWRAFLTWIPVTVLLSLAGNLDVQRGGGIELWVWWASVGLLLTYVALALVYPARSLHDRLAGTWLVPR